MCGDGNDHEKQNSAHMVNYLLYGLYQSLTEPVCSKICNFKVNCINAIKQHILICHGIRCPYCATDLISCVAMVTRHLSKQHRLDSTAAEVEAQRMVNSNEFFNAIFF